MNVPHNVQFAFTRLTVKKLAAKGMKLGQPEIDEMFKELCSSEFWNVNGMSALKVLRDDPEADPTAKAFATKYLEGTS